MGKAVIFRSPVSLLLQGVGPEQIDNPEYKGRLDPSRD